MSTHLPDHTPVPIEIDPLVVQGGSRNWTDTITGRILASSILTAEITPANEAIRLAALGFAIYQGLDPVAAGAVVGITTMTVEGSAGIATADLLDSNGGKRTMDYLQGVMEKVGVDHLPNTNLLTDAGIATIGGSAVVTAVKHVQDPERTRAQNRRYGLVASLGNAAVSGGLGYSIAAGIKHPSPMTIGLALGATGAVVGTFKWAKNRISHESEVVHKSVNKGESPQCLGLSTEDLKLVLEDSRTKSVVENDKEVPVLVPIDQLYWYNKDYLQQRFGTEEIYYYAHPDIQSADSKLAAYEYVTEIAENGGVVLYDTVTAGNVVYGDLDHELTQVGLGHQKVPIRKDGRQRFLYQYDGEFKVRKRGSHEYVKAPSMYETYEKAVADGDIVANQENGPALQNIIEGEEAERLWAIYQKPFERLSHEHPINSGFDKDGFMNMLQDPEAVKAVYRDNGEVTTLALFVNNLEHCSWLDPEYYKAKYPEAIETRNHFIFPGIVTDELKRGASYSIPLIQLIAKVQAMRRTPAVISFECTDISYKYIPRIVRFAIAKSGVAKTVGFKRPVSRFDYYAITK